MRLDSLKNIVEATLESNPKTRNSDPLLYAEVCRRTNPEVAGLSFLEVMGHPRKYGIPNYESIRRSRQKVQELRADLAPSEPVKDYRTEFEKTYRKFARR